MEIEERVQMKHKSGIWKETKTEKERIGKSRKKKFRRKNKGEEGIVTGRRDDT